MITNKNGKITMDNEVKSLNQENKEETLASIQSLSKDDNSDFEKEDKSYVYGFIKGALVGLAIFFILSYLI